jgi:hypothetical protein
MQLLLGLVEALGQTVAILCLQNSLRHQVEVRVMVHQGVQAVEEVALLLGFKVGMVGQMPLMMAALWEAAVAVQILMAVQLVLSMVVRVVGV